MTGRWPNRDPLGEFGGLNLYVIVENNSVIRIDRLGLEKITASVSLVNSTPAADPEYDEGFVSGEDTGVNITAKVTVDVECSNDGKSVSWGQASVEIESGDANHLFGKWFIGGITLGTIYVNHTVSLQNQPTDTTVDCPNDWDGEVVIRDYSVDLSSSLNISVPFIGALGYSKALFEGVRDTQAVSFAYGCCKCPE
jgi:hypothetical protein